MQVEAPEVQLPLDNPFHGPQHGAPQGVPDTVQEPLETPQANIAEKCLAQAREKEVLEVEHIGQALWQLPYQGACDNSCTCCRIRDRVGNVAGGLAVAHDQNVFTPGRLSIVELTGVQNLSTLRLEIFCSGVVWNHRNGEDAIGDDQVIEICGCRLFASCGFG